MNPLVTEKPTSTVARSSNKLALSASGAIPPLENGDRLSRAEFERRYVAHPEILKAELIEGVAYVASPVRVRRHGVPHSDIIGWLSTYRAATPGVNQTDNSTLRLDLDNEPQPDVSVWIEGGHAFVDEDDYRRVAHATNSHQLLCLNLHALHGVDDENHTVNGRQSSVGVFRKIFVTGSVEKIDERVIVFKRHHRGCHRDSTLPFNVHEIGSRAFANLV